MDLDVTLVRHAEAAWPEGRSGTDPPLTDRGVRQAAHLAERAARWKKPTHVLVSPALRARQTADPLCAALGATGKVAPWLSEIELAGGSLGAARAAGGVDAHTWATFRGRATLGLTTALAAVGAVPDAAPGERPPRTWTLGGD